MVLHHHERYDGKWVSSGLEGRPDPFQERGSLPSPMRWINITSNCRLQPSISLETAVREIKKMSGKPFDPDMVNEFLRVPVIAWKAMRREIAAKTKRSDFLSLRAAIGE